VSLDEGIALLQEAQTKNPQAFDVHWQLARFLYWKATESDRKTKAALAEQGWQAGQKAIQLNANRVEGHYWAAACVGAWSDSLGIPRSIAKGLTDKFEVPAKRAVEIEPNHDGGGPLRVLGRFYATIPWPFKDVEKARGLLERALEAGPTSGTNLYFLAELAHQSKDDELGGAYLVSLITLDPSDGDGPEIVRYQKVGKDLAEQIL